MYDVSRPFDYEAVSAAQRQTVMGNVLRLLGIAFLCTALGALIGIRIGLPAFLISIVGSIGTLIALYFAREKAPANLWLLYAFATFASESALTLLAGHAPEPNPPGTPSLFPGMFARTTPTSPAATWTPELRRAALTVKLADVPDGTSNTLFIGETLPEFCEFQRYTDPNRGGWAEGSNSITQGQTILLAVGVYLDIFNLFLALLRIFGAFGSRDD